MWALSLGRDRRDPDDRPVVSLDEPIMAASSPAISPTPDARYGEALRRLA